MEAGKSPPTTIDEYIAQWPEDIQRILEEIRVVIRKAAPAATDKISYQMPHFYQKGAVAWFAVHSHHIGFYPTASGIEAFREELSAYKWAKGSVQFPLDKPIPYDLISRIIEFKVAENLSKPESRKRLTNRRT